MPYSYDVFVSYQNDPIMGDWVRDHLVPLMELLISNELNRKLKLFIDREGLQAGDAWPERLGKALAESRCLVAVWNPLYFHSDWCRRECAVMLHRERKYGFRTRKKPTGLILPVTVHDGEYFPEVAKRVQWLDCHDYWLAGSAFPQTSEYIKFQKTLKGWAPDVARAVSNAPSWRKVWQTDECLDVSTAELEPMEIRNFPFSGLE